MGRAAGAEARAVGKVVGERWLRLGVGGSAGEGEALADGMSRGRVDVRGRIEEAVGIVVGLQQGLDPSPQCRVSGAGLIEVRRPLGRVFLQGR